MSTNRAKSLSGADLIAGALVENGVDTVFSLCGNHLLPLYRAFVDRGIRIVDTRSEAAAVFAADGYARSSRRLGVAVVTGGPGFTNGLTGLATAHTSGSPVLLLSGASSLSARGTGQHQEIDQVAAAKPYVKYARETGIGQDPGADLDRMLKSLLAFPSGAGSLSVPLDVMTATDFESDLTPAATDTPGTVGDSAIDRMRRLIREARRPVLILGQGGYWEGAEDAVVSLCRRLSIPLFTMDVAHGSITEDGDICFGYPDAALRPLGELLQESDLAAVLGRGLDNRLVVGQTFPSDVDVIEVGANQDLPWSQPSQLLRFSGSVASFLETMASESVIEEDVEADRKSWLARFREGHSRWVSEADAEGANVGSDGEELNPRSVATTIEKSIGRSVTIALDAGDFVQWCRAVITPRGKGKWLRGGRMSTCGSALPLAIGSAVATGEPALAVVGDGSLGYHVSELETMCRLQLPVVCVVGNNHAWGLEYNLQASLYGTEYIVASRLGDVNFASVAAAMGVRSFSVATLRELEERIKGSLDDGIPTLIEVQVTLEPSPLTKAVIAKDGHV